MIEIVAFIILIFNLYIFIGFVIELVLLVRDYNNNIYVNNSRKHSVEHIEYISLYILFIISLHGWFFGHGGILHGFNLHLIEEFGFIIFFILGLSSRYLLNHIKDERINNCI